MASIPKHSFAPRQLPNPPTAGNPQGMAWYVPAGAVMHYLHRDGEVRQGTMHNGERTGYFASEDEAKAAIRLFVAKHCEAAS